MARSVLAAFALLIALTAPLSAQTPAPEQRDETVTEPPAPEAPPAAAPRSIVGSWEFSNADREKTCTITFRNDATKVGKRVDFDAACADNFPFIRDVEGWQYNPDDFLRLLDARGNSVVDFSEVETGMFEGPKPGEGILFIQNPSNLGPPPKTAQQITGEWSIIRRTGRVICTLSLTNAVAGDEFVVRVNPPCDPVISRFAPVTWQVDRGEIVLRAANGQSWRFEETENARWQRIPPTANPILMTRK
jgi:hypothetical protein